MIESSLRAALGTLSGLPVYPLLLPDPVQEGVTFQRISDPEMDNGLVRTGLVAARFQITTYRVDDYTALVELDRKIWSAWRNIRQGEIAGYPVQYVERGSIQQNCYTLPNNHVQYRMARDYILYFYEDTMIRMEVQGLADLERQLEALGEKIAVKVLSEAGKEAIQIVQEDMRQHAGYDETSPGPHMRDSIKTTSRNRMKDGRWLTVVTIRVGPSKEHSMKALAQEFGTVKQVADPFMRPALDYNRQKILRVLAVSIREGIGQNR